MPDLHGARLLKQPLSIRILASLAVWNMALPMQKRLGAPLNIGLFHMFEELAGQKFGTIYADPPWHFEVWSGRANRTPGGYQSRAVERHYDTMSREELAALPVADLAAEDAVLFMWICWPTLQDAFKHAYPLDTHRNA